MAQILALDWNGREARAALASRRGDQIVIKRTFLVPVSAAEEGKPEPNVGTQVVEALSAQGIGQVDALVAVGRGSVELRQLQLPAAAEDELPKMVQLRAMLEFNELDEKWPLDFVPVDEPGGANRTVLAAAIAPELVARIQGVCEKSGLRMQHLVLRSCAAAGLLARAPGTPRGEVQLLVEFLADQADLTVTLDGKVLFLRTMRLNAALPPLPGLLAELRLTMAAAQNQLGGRQVTRIVLCGRGDAEAALARQVEKETTIRTALFDPFAGLELGSEARQSPPAQPGRFAAVLGMLLAAPDQARYTIDFLHPRRTVEAAPPRNKWKMAAVAAGVLLVAYLAYNRLDRWWLESDLGRLRDRAAAADTALAQGGKKRLDDAKEIGKWTDDEVLWLDHLRALSQDCPPSRSMDVSHLTLSAAERASAAHAVAPSAAGDLRGKIALEGRARNIEAVTEMEKKLAAHGRRVDPSKTTTEDRSRSGEDPYSVTFTTTMLVGREPKP